MSASGVKELGAASDHFPEKFVEEKVHMARSAFPPEGCLPILSQVLPQ